MRSLSLVTAPLEEPVTVDEVKDHSRIVGTDDDTYIGNLITSARLHAEGYLKRALVSQIWSMKTDEGLMDVEIPKPPLVTVDSINYIDADGNNQLLNSSVYTVDSDSTPGRVVLAYDQSWPDTRDVIQNVTIEFTCGYGTEEDVPQDIKQAILWQVDHWYEHRSTVSELRLIETPQHYINVLYPHRVNIL